MKEISKELLNGCRKGDRKSQTELYAIVFSTLLSMSKRYFVNNDERITMVNNCFIKLIKSLDNYSGEGVFEAWCRKLMINVIIDEYRSNKRWKETMVLTERMNANESSVFIHQTDEKYTSEQLEKMLAKLPTVSRCVFNLFAIEGYSHKEIATMLNISEGTSKWHVNKAREDLKKMLSAVHTTIG
jgi:RNA polymerase sigma factor (sigma-70 family)